MNDDDRIIVGDLADIIAGAGSIITAGAGSTIIAGAGSFVSMKWYDRDGLGLFVTSIVGEGGLMPGVPYRLSNDGQWVTVRRPASEGDKMACVHMERT